MSGVCSCLFGSGTSGLHTMLFQTSKYMSDCMSICMCVCSGPCLHRCMYMSRTHSTHIHAHNTHTCLGLYVCNLVVCALQEVQHVSTFTPLALGPELIPSWKVRGAVWPVCDPSRISLCCPTCCTCPGTHTVSTKFIMCATCASTTSG